MNGTWLVAFAAAVERFQIVGDGEDRGKIEDLIKELNLEDKVSLLGNRTNMDEIYSGMDIFLFPSLFEGLSVALVEAQTSGLMIFATEGTIPEEMKLVDDNYYTISLNENEEKWAEIISEKYKDGYERKDTTKSIESAGFNINKEVKKIEEIF